jgi:hypothetical protein
VEKKGTSWGWIIFWLIIFWPVGLILVIKKLATDKAALMSGKTGALLVIGWILVIIGGIAFLALISEPNNGGPTFFMLLILAGGIALLSKASKTKKTARKYKKYIDIAVNQNVRSIDNIASAVGLSYAVVSKDLQNMINIGYLKDAYIHQGNREIVLKQREYAVYAQPSVAGQAAPQTVAARCPGCGANNVVTVGSVAECEYCGNAINA